MFIPRDGIALADGGSFLGRAHGNLLSLTSHHPLWFERNPNTKKSQGAAANSGNAGKSWATALAGKHEKPLSEIRLERHGVIETAGLRAESLRTNVAVRATSEVNGANSKMSRIRLPGTPLPLSRDAPLGPRHPGPR